MSWIQKLYDTYELCKGFELGGTAVLLPVSHAFQQAHIEVTLDASGKFESARALSKVETAIPATERSAGRTANCAPHPLCDKIQYCAGDYAGYGGAKPAFFVEYKTLLSAWCQSRHSHAKATAVLAYIQKGNLVADLVRERVLHVGGDGKLLMRWPEGSDPAPEIFKVLTAKAGDRDQGDALVRWQVRESGTARSEVWLDQGLQDAWARFDAETKVLKGLCMVTGEAGASLAESHPKRIRHAGDGAKIISANDSSGFTFRGRFTDDTGLQASGVGYQVTQKAHNALRWLIQRQAYRNGDQIVVSWAVGGAPIPDPFANTFSLLQGDSPEVALSQVHLDADAGQSFALRLKQRLRGYNTQLGATQGIVVMGLDSATPGRLAITYYRELTGSEFFERLEQWHIDHAWHQFFSKDRRFVGAPAPHDIAEAAYGQRVDEKLKKSVLERLLPSIVDGQQVPRDLVNLVVRRVCNRVSQKHWEWEKNLGIACGLFSGLNKGRGYQMGLETDRRSRDYLYGRLLALAERVESMAIYLGGEGRDTAAAKLMQRFADRPASTWRTIELALAPAKSRLRAKRGGAMHGLDKLHDDIVAMFQGDEFMDDRKLSGEFLLGYHCQRRELMPKTQAESNTPTDPTNAP